MLCLSGFELYSRWGPCVRKLLTGLIMYIYPLKIKNIVLYCIVLYCILGLKDRVWNIYLHSPLYTLTLIKKILDEVFFCYQPRLNTYVNFDYFVYHKRILK